MHLAPLFLRCVRAPTHTSSLLETSQLTLSIIDRYKKKSILLRKEFGLLISYIARTTSSPAMGAWFSTPKSPSCEDGTVVNSDNALTRIRILPQSSSSPVVRDVHLPASAVISIESLLAFIHTLSMMETLSSHELSRGEIHLLLHDGSAPTMFAIKSDDDNNAQFGAQMDRVWVKNQRCVITVLARLRADPDTSAAEKHMNATGAVIESVWCKKKSNDKGNDVHDLEDVADLCSNEEGEKMGEGPKANLGNIGEGVCSGDGNDRIITEKAIPAAQSQLAKGMSSAEMEEYEPNRSHDEQQRRQASSPSQFQSQEAKDQSGKDDALKDAGSDTMPEESVNDKTPTQTRSRLASAAAPATSKSQTVKDEQRAKLQQELQNKISSSLKSRGKPTYSQNTSYKHASPSGIPGSGVEATIKADGTGAANKYGSTINSPI